MPKTAIEEMRQLTAEEARDGAHGLALALALGEVTKALERVANRLDKTDEKMEDMSARLIRMEASSSSDLAKESKLRIDILERELAAWKNRGLAGVAIITLFWALFGQGIQNFVSQVVN